MKLIEIGIKIVRKIKEHGFEAYLVGGCVRDYLLGNEIFDIDVTTNALLKDLNQIFEIKKQDDNFFSATILYEGVACEITTFRTELGYKNHRFPIVEIAHTLEEDLMRRDFTINALAMDETYCVYDFHHGQEDLKNKIIRTVQNPEKSLTEDALRMMRACYFAGKLGFELEMQLVQTIQQYAELLAVLSFERISKELEKILNNKHAKQSLRYLYELGLTAYMKGYHEGIEFLLQCEEVLSFSDLRLVSYALNERFQENAFSKEERMILHGAIQLAEVVEDNNYNVLILYANGLQICLLSNRLNYLFKKSPDISVEIKKRYQALLIHKTCDMSLKGQDLIALGYSENVDEIHHILDDLKYQILTKQVENQYEALLKYVSKNYQKKHL